MEIRYCLFQTLCGFVGGIIVGFYFDADPWVYVILAPATGAVGYYLSLWKLRSLDLKPDTTLLDYIDAVRKRWDPQRQRKTLTDYIDDFTKWRNR